ncbi:MAG TPA: polysaccharide deacetylase family protein, partial [Gemmatimonadaceae bacterium]|nr:polysaccharide deacetylase family protein [Gemmatimonadaceae bacterium]
DAGGSVSVRSLVKTAAEATLTAPLVIDVLRRRVRGRSLILAYHNVVSDDTPRGDRTLHLPLRAFVAQLDAAARHYDVVTLPQLLSGSSRRPRIAVTFDDAYCGAIKLALPELRKRGMPSTVFVAPGRLGGHTFWWDALATRDAGLSPDARRHALHELQGKDERVRAWAAASGFPSEDVPAEYHSASEDDLHAAAAGGHVHYGAHTWSHPSLPDLDAQDLQRELERPLPWLRERFACAIPWLAYPYGHSSPAVAAATQRAGYEAACLVAGGWLGRESGDRFALARQNIPDMLSVNGFRLRLAGLFCE